jgi:hypothetical protein
LFLCSQLHLQYTSPSTGYFSITITLHLHQSKLSLHQFKMARKSKRSKRGSMEPRTTIERVAMYLVVAALIAYPPALCSAILCTSAILNGGVIASFDASTSTNLALRLPDSMELTSASTALVPIATIQSFAPMESVSWTTEPDVGVVGDHYLAPSGDWHEIWAPELGFSHVTISTFK